MKKLHYLLAFAALAFTACQKEPALQSKTPLTSKMSLNVTLQSSDYGKLASGYPKTSFTFDDLADANTYIPQILNAEYLTAADGSTAKVTYNVSSLYFKVKDSVLSDVSYTLTNADYLLLTGNKYADFSAAQMLSWMDEDTSVYQTSVVNQIAVVTFTPYPSTITPPVPYTYVKLAKHNWKQAYMIQPAQYAALGVGKYNEFTPTANPEASLVGSFNFFLKNDVTIMDTIKKNDLVYVSFNYYVAANNTTTPPTPAMDYQRVKPVQYDGSNFVAPYNQAAAGVATFVRANGTWKPEPVVSYKLSTADIALIGANTTAYPGAANLAQYGDFDSAWTIPYMNAAIIQCLLVDFPNPAQNTLYQVTFNNYSSPAPNPSSFTWDGTKWVALQ